MLRAASEADVPAMLDIYAPYVRNTTVTFEYDVPAQAEFLRRFREITAQFPWLVWEENGEIFGYAYASAPFTRDAYRWCAEDSVYLRPEAQGQGIGQALCGAVEEILTRQGYRRIYAIITSENRKSISFHQKIGYHFLAEFPDCGFKFGRWLGVTWLEKTLNFAGVPNGFPESWQDVRRN